MKRFALVVLFTSAQLFGGESSPARFDLRPPPSLRIGDWLRLDFRAKVQTDFRDLRGIDPEAGVFDLRRARVGIEGRFLRNFEFQLERELSPTSHPWRDAYVNWRRLRKAQVQAGKFMAPFSMDQLTGSGHLDFVNRSLVASYLAPGRETGVVVHGRLAGKNVSYQAGLFRQDGENARNKERQGAGGKMFVARVTGKPGKFLPLPGILRSLEVGGASAASVVPEGPNGLRGQGTVENTFFRRLDVSGGRRRLGAEFRWQPAPFTLKGEFITVSEERRGQGLGGEDLSSAISRGWYLSGVWAAFRNRNSERNVLELAGRSEQIRFGSALHPGRPTRSPRASNVLGNSDRVWSFGLNWTPNRYVRLQFNGIHERFEDIQRAPAPGRTGFWTAHFRMQFTL